MQMSQNTASIVPALLKAQKEMGGAVKSSKNPYFKSSYADLGSVLAACKDILNAHGIVILQPHFSNDKGTYVQTVLFHESGEFITSDTPVVCSKPNDPQALGSAITYARRYSLQSFLSMPAEDDDGESAVDRTWKAPAKNVEVASSQLSVAKAAVSAAVAEVLPAETTKPKNSWRKPKPDVVASATTVESSDGY